MIFTALSFLRQIHGLFFMKRPCQLDYMKMFKDPTLNKNKKEETHKIFSVLEQV